MRKMIMVVTLALVAAACGGTQQIGSRDGREGIGGDAGRLGEIVKSESPTPTATATQKQDTKKDDGKKDEPKEEEISVSFLITAAGFEPYQIKVFVGSLVKVTNKDSIARSIVASDGEFDSGDLAPGKSWIYKADKVGSFAFQDGTRPYVNGTLEVVPK